MFKVFILAFFLTGNLCADLVRQEDYEIKQQGTQWEAKFAYDVSYAGKSTVFVVRLNADDFPGRADIPTDSELMNKADSYASVQYSGFKSQLDTIAPVKTKKKGIRKVVRND